MKTPLQVFGSAVLLVSLAAPAPAQAARVWVVDDSPGPDVDSATIQGAVDLAADGDVVLVRSGIYAGFEVASKSLAVAVDLGDNALIALSQVRIRDLAPEQHVVVRGFIVSGGSLGPPVDQAPLRITDVAGSVWLEDCTFQNANGTPPGFPFQNQLPATAGALALECADLTAVRCSFLGRSYPYFGSPMPELVSGLYARNSRVALYDSSLSGADGAGGPPCGGTCPGFRGGAGLALDASTAHVVGSDLNGGPGRLGGTGTALLSCGDGGDGGHGLHLLASSASQALLLASTTTPGPGGPGGVNLDGSMCNAGASGQAVVAAPSSVVSFPGPARLAELPSPTRAQQPSTLTVQGDDGDLVLVFASLAPLALPLPELGSLGHLAPPWFLLLTATLPPGGTLSLPLVAPSIPGAPLDEGRTFRLQAAHVTTALQLRLGAPMAWTVLHSGF